MIKYSGSNENKKPGGYAKRYFKPIKGGGVCPILKHLWITYAVYIVSITK